MRGRSPGTLYWLRLTLPDPPVRRTARPLPGAVRAPSAGAALAPAVSRCRRPVVCLRPSWSSASRTHETGGVGAVVDLGVASSVRMILGQVRRSLPPAGGCVVHREATRHALHRRPVDRLRARPSTPIVVPVAAADPSLPVVFGRSEARAAGLSDDQMTRRLRSSHWTRLRRGLYHPAPDPAEHLRWRAEIIAHLRAHARPLVLSHTHAARAWGLPAPLGGWGAPTFTGVGGSPRAGAVVIRVGPLQPSDIEAMGRVPVTSLARTVVDCARTLPGRDALAIADAALRRGAVTLEQIGRVLDRQRGWPGVTAARRVVALADGRRETPLESWSAWSFDEHGVPQPTWQVEVCDEEGVVIGRVDGLWPEAVAGEADGRAKYRLAARERGGADAETLAAVLDDERLREMALRGTGLSVVRWDPRDVLVPSRAVDLAAHLLRELARGGVFRGKAYLS